MKIQFLGGAEEVGRVGIHVQMERTRLLVDYGFSPSSPPLYPMDVPAIDLALLSHCHVDHSGMIPYLTRAYDVDVLATAPTIALSELLARDSIKVADSEGYPAPYTKEDIKNAKEHFKLIKFNETTDIGGMELHTHSAGHIPGATMFELRGEKTALFTGDLNTIHTQLVWGAHPVKCDILFIEGTYSGNSHPLRSTIERGFRDRVIETVENGGVAVIPSFAVGRTQEMMMLTRDLEYEVWLDGMGRAVTRLMLQSPEHLRSSKRLAKAFKNIKVIHSEFGRKTALKGDVIITTSGMLDGGPVLWYLQHLKGDKKSAVLLTGYQVEGSNGKRLLESRMLDFYGVLEKVNCDISFFDFSAHSGHEELVSFVRGCDPEKVVIYHSDDRQPLADALSEYDVYMPKNGETFEL